MYHDISNHIVPQVFWKKKTIFLNVFPFFKEKKRIKEKDKKNPTKWRIKEIRTKIWRVAFKLRWSMFFPKYATFPLWSGRVHFINPTLFSFPPMKRNCVLSFHSYELDFTTKYLFVGENRLRPIQQLISPQLIKLQIFNSQQFCSHVNAVYI